MGVTPLIAVRLPVALRKELERTARRRKVSLSEAVREAIAAFVAGESGR